MKDEHAERHRNEAEGTPEPERVEQPPTSGGSLKPERVQYEAPFEPPADPADGAPVPEP